MGLYRPTTPTPCGLSSANGELVVFTLSNHLSELPPCQFQVDNALSAVIPIHDSPSHFRGRHQQVPMPCE